MIFFSFFINQFYLFGNLTDNYIKKVYLDNY